MPPSALDRLGEMFLIKELILLCLILLSESSSITLMNHSASLHIDYPMLFELRNAAAERVSHCGVLEFIAEEGMIYMPYWVSI